MTRKAVNQSTWESPNDEHYDVRLCRLGSSLVGRRADLGGRTAGVHTWSAVSPSSQPVPPCLVHKYVHKSCC